MFYPHNFSTKLIKEKVLSFVDNNNVNQSFIGLLSLLIDLEKPVDKIGFKQEKILTKKQITSLLLENGYRYADKVDSVYVEKDYNILEKNIPWINGWEVVINLKIKQSGALRLLLYLHYGNCTTLVSEQYSIPKANISNLLLPNLENEAIDYLNLLYRRYAKQG